MTNRGPRWAGLPISFWVMIGFGLACIIAGAVVGFAGPQLFPSHPVAEQLHARLAIAPHPAK